MKLKNILHVQRSNITVAEWHNIQPLGMWHDVFDAQCDNLALASFFSPSSFPVQHQYVTSGTADSWDRVTNSRPLPFLLARDSDIMTSSCQQNRISRKHNNVLQVFCFKLNIHELDNNWFFLADPRSKIELKCTNRMIPLNMTKQT